MRIRLLATFCFICLVSPYAAFADLITVEDIIIIEITAKDLGLNIKSLKKYYKNTEQRSKFRKATADLITTAAPKARFIMLDMWFPDLLNTEADQELINAIKSTKYITLAGAGPYQNKIEATHPRFRESVAEVGHIFLYDGDPDTFSFHIVYCADGENWTTPPENCSPQLKERHIGFIAAEGFIRKKLNHPEDGYYTVPRVFFSPFQRITYSEYLKNPEVVAEKLVIVINKPLPSVDIHKTLKGGKITGSEILAKVILLYANTIPLK